MEHTVRAQYESAVVALRVLVGHRLASGISEEHVARWAVDQRNRLKQVYRDLTPNEVLVQLQARTLLRYGNTLGPSADQLRDAGKSWKEIIDASARPGKHSVRSCSAS